MIAEKEHIDELIGTYLSTGLEGTELDELETWLAACPDHRAYFHRLQEIWFSALSREEEAVYDPHSAFEQFKFRVAQSGTDAHRCFPWAVCGRCAVLVLLLCSVACFSYWRGGSNVKETFAEVTVEAPMGSQTKLALPDGTQVWLNAGSALTYSQGFGVDNRSVSLSGEGYFEVAHNKSLPFSVQTASLQVKVLGTKFNFHDYPDDTEAVVSLSEGKVALHSLLGQGGETLLAPDERVVLNKQSGKMHVESAVAAHATQWTGGCLFFDEALLSDVAKELERCYNVKIHIASDSLKSMRFYGSFVRRELGVREVLDRLAGTQKLRYRTDGRDITIYGSTK